MSRNVVENSPLAVATSVTNRVLKRSLRKRFDSVIRIGLPLLAGVLFILAWEKQLFHRMLD